MITHKEAKMVEGVLVCDCGEKFATFTKWSDHCLKEGDINE